MKIVLLYKLLNILHLHSVTKTSIRSKNSFNFIIQGGSIIIQHKSHITPPVFFTQFDQYNLGLALLRHAKSVQTVK